MTNLFRLFMAAGVCFLALLFLLVSLSRHDQNLAAPANFLMFMVVVAVYLLPIGVALYRNCEATLWIATVDLLLGWTMIGWIIALGWANAGKTRPLPPTGHPPTHPLPSH
jgi:hypothetical protein